MDHFANIRKTSNSFKDDYVFLVLVSTLFIPTWYIHGVVAALNAGAVLLNNSDIYINGSSVFFDNSATDDGGKTWNVLYNVKKGRNTPWYGQRGSVDGNLDCRVLGSQLLLCVTSDNVQQGSSTWITHLTSHKERELSLLAITHNISHMCFISHLTICAAYSDHTIHIYVYS